jgi:hypothetical protein
MKIYDREGLNPDVQRLIFAGREIESEKKFIEYGIKNSSTIYNVLRLRSTAGNIYV